MFKLFLALAVLLSLLILLFVFPVSLPAQDHLVVFGGYSYLRPPVTATESVPCLAVLCPEPVLTQQVTNDRNLNGYEFSATYRFLGALGIAVDFSGHYGSAVPNSSSSVHQYTGLVGPEFSFPSRISPFAHFLFGGVHQAVTSGPLNVAVPVGTSSPYTVTPNTLHSFAEAWGGGIDIRLIPHVWLRPIQIDYLLTHLHNSAQSQPRVSAGLVLHF